MNILRKFAVVFLFIMLVPIGGCAMEKTYVSNTYGYSFSYRSSQTVTTQDNTVIVNLSDDVTAVIYAQSALAYADQYYLSLYSEDELDLHSGAFEANYNNTLFISQMLDYLFADSDQGISPYAIRQSEFAGVSAWQAEFTSESDELNGTVYVTVQKSISYVVVIYISDTYDNRHHYDKIIENFTDNFKF